MIKHKYSVYGVSCVGGSLFNGTCVADDIIKAIELFREKQCSVWNIERKEQVSADTEIGIKSLNILGGYSAEGKSRANIYSLYKRIMKRDPKAVDDINTLEEAKEIIKMITGNIYLNGELYNFDFKKYVEENGIKVQTIQVGGRIFCEGQRSCLKLEEKLNSKGIKTKIENNEAGLWSVFIESVPCGDGEISVYDGYGLMNFETCQHRKDVDIMGIKRRSLFCDFDDMECDESDGKCRNQDKF